MGVCPKVPLYVSYVNMGGGGRVMMRAVDIGGVSMMEVVDGGGVDDTMLWYTLICFLCRGLLVRASR